MFVILNWSCPDDIELIRGEDGRVRLFETEEAANRHAEEELNLNWEVVEIA